MTEYVPLHCHSAFSFHAGVPSVRDLVAHCRDRGLQAAALTDTDRVSGLILFYLECRLQGIKPVLGVELTDPAQDGRTGAPTDGAGVAGKRRLVLLARDAAGYGDLCELTTRRHVEASSFRLCEELSRPWPNLVLITADPQMLAQLAAGANRESLYGELVNNSEYTRRRSRQLLATARAHGVPLVASNDSFFLERDDWETHRILTAIGLNSTLSRLKAREVAAAGACARTTAAMERAFPDQREALANTARVAALCDVELDLGHWIMPRVTVPDGHTPESYLERLAVAGLKSNYGRAEADTRARATAIQRMELEVIAKLGYPSYFLMVKEIRDWANERFGRKYRQPQDCTILRGSAANSITFYNIGVSDLDPIRYDLYFERFLNEDRASPPDADLDFGWDERDEALEFMVDRWGADRVAVTCTTNHFRERAAFRETAKVFGYTDEQVSEILTSYRTRSKRIEDADIDRIWELAGHIRGKPRFLGQHPGGVLVTNDPIRRHVACEYSGGEKNRLITQIDMHNGIDELGLIKFDILGNGSLSVLRDTLDQLAEQGVADPEVWDLEKCYADPDVRDVIRKGRTKGIFYIESPAQRRLNQKAQAQTFEEITITSSLVRPAGAKYTQLFVERERQRKQGIRDWEFVHPSLASILSETHDVCAFQEDVTRICHEIAGLGFKEADKIRKMMNSQHEGAPTDEAWAATARAFLGGCRRHSGLTPEQAAELWERVSSFTGFSFCKSHSATYAQLSFQCTYLKAHYPAQFMAAVISNGHGFYRRDVYLNEARRWGITVLPLDVNESGVAYRGSGHYLRPGFIHVRGMRRSILERVVAERAARGPFGDLVDFTQRLRGGVDGIHRAEVERLILVGAFGRFGLTQPQSLFLLDDLIAPGSDDGTDLFAAAGEEAGVRCAPIDSVDCNLAERCLRELDLLGFMLSGDILEILQLHPGAREAIDARDLGRFAGKGRVKLFGRQVTERMHRVQRSGEPMMFLTIEDRTESADVILWPDVFERFADVVVEPGPFEIWGRVTADWGTYCLEADTIRCADWAPNQVDLELASRRLARSFAGREFMYADVDTAAA